MNKRNVNQHGTNQGSTRSTVVGTCVLIYFGRWKYFVVMTKICMLKEIMGKYRRCRGYYKAMVWTHFWTSGSRFWRRCKIKAMEYTTGWHEENFPKTCQEGPSKNGFENVMFDFDPLFNKNCLKQAFDSRSVFAYDQRPRFQDMPS